MARYDIYGIGAALVDTEVEVSDSFLADAKINKGVMTLVDEARQEELLEALSSEDLILVKKCGGSVCNSVVKLQMMPTVSCISMILIRLEWTSTQRVRILVPRASA